MRPTASVCNVSLLGVAALRSAWCAMECSSCRPLLPVRPTTPPWFSDSLCLRYGASCLFQVLDEAACRALGMGLFVGVAQGSDEPLQFVHLTYTAPGRIAHKVCRSGGVVQGGLRVARREEGGDGLHMRGGGERGRAC